MKEMADRMKEARSQVMMAVIISLWKAQKFDSQRWAEFLKKESRAGDAGSMLALPRGSAFLQLSGNRDGLEKAQTEWAEAVWDSEWQPDKPEDQNQEIDETDLQLQNKLTESLWFETIDDRGAAISRAYQETFEWVFSQDVSDKDAPKFVQWLRTPPTSEEQSIYCKSWLPPAQKTN